MNGLHSLVKNHFRFQGRQPSSGTNVLFWKKMNTDIVTDGFGRRLWFLVGQEGDRVVLPLEDVTDQGTALILLVPFIHAPSHFKN